MRYPLTHRRSRRSWPPCVAPATAFKAAGCAAWSWCCGAPGLRIHEALALSEADLDSRRGSLLVRRGKGGRRREVGMDDWAWEQLEPWLTARVALPIAPLFCVVILPNENE
jgi:integrase